MARKKSRPDEGSERVPDEGSEPVDSARAPGPSPKRAGAPKKKAAAKKVAPVKKRARQTPDAGGRARPAIPEVDWEMIEQAMWQMLGREVPGDSNDPQSPRPLAADLLHRAYSERTPAKVVKLAEQALLIWPDCADAYVLLAEHSRSPREAIDLYTKGMRAAERDLGPEAFTLGEGHFWSIMPTRPYMRARLGLAQVLWVVGRRDEAVGHYRALLTLNPGDNQGVRYRLASALIELGREDELETLLNTYEGDASACWYYSAALLAFRREGDTSTSRRLLASAKRANRHVPDYLTGKTGFPSSMPEGVGFGDVNEAVDYAAGFLNGWRATPGALEWLRKAGRKSAPKPPRPPATKGPTDASKTRLTKLKQAEDVWQVDARLLPLWINAPENPYRPWVVVVASASEGLILGQEVCPVFPSADFVWDKLVKLMTAPLEGRPHRPAVVQLGSSDRWLDLIPALDDVEVRAETFARLDVIDDVVRRLVEHVNGRPPMPGLLEMPGVALKLAASFYGAAVDFYRAAPWQRIGGGETVKIDSPRFESGPWYVVVFGQMGMTLGVALYDDLKTLVRIRDGHATDEQNARETVALSLTYGDKTEISVPDLDAIEEHGWPVADTDAYPAPVRKERGLMMRPPLAWELQLLEATMRALPDFLTGHDRGDASTRTVTVPTGAGPLELELSWVPNTGTT